MKRLFGFILSILLGVAFVLLSAQFASADDVYNFYFQKAPGVNKVIQGGSQVVEQEAAEDSKLPQSTDTSDPAVNQPSVPPSNGVSTAAAVPAPEVKKENKWEVYGGIGHIANNMGRYRGYSAGAQYNVSKYIGASVALTYADKSYENDGLPLADLYRPTMDFSAGLTFTPLKFSLFGWNFLDIGMCGGIMSVSNFDEGGTPKYSRDAIAYLGPRIALNFSDDVGIIFESRLKSQQSEYGQMTAGMVMRF